VAKLIEMRQYLRKFTLADAKSGLQPIRQNLPGGVELFAPPTLQWRQRETVFTNGQKTLEWSEWSDVLFVREGDETPPAAT